ncbi:MAG: hemolysin-type calcium-binding protein [Rhodospirillaceae bacterium]|nr:MAG: hemolysin-type calcium-binding protein [Rhodospirillaceae bacterium]
MRRYSRTWAESTGGAPSTDTTGTEPAPVDTVTDTTVTATTVTDDAPRIATPAPGTVSEAVGGVKSVSGALGIDFGADGAASTGGLKFPQGIAAPTGLTSRGDPINYGLDATGTVLTATAGGREVFTVALNPNTGTYTFTLKDGEGVTHASSTANSRGLDFSFSVQRR